MSNPITRYRRRQRVWVCSVCGHRFGDRETISQHMAAYHPKDNQFCCVATCGKCGKVFEFTAKTMKEAKAKADQGRCCGLPFLKPTAAEAAGGNNVD